MHVVMANWRDTKNPEGGGSERYVENVAAGLAAAGHRVTLLCAAHDRAPADETVHGVRFRRRGNKLSVYLMVFATLFLRRLGKVDVVVDVQNGLPFFTRLATRARVVVLIHHVHREQWPVVYPGRIGRIGWWIESRLSPRLYRGCQYITVSEATRGELIELGVDRDRITVIHNGTDAAPALDVQRSTTPRICVLGRLVPHKQVEHAIDAAASMANEGIDVHLDVVGDGWWSDELHAHAARRGVEARVTFHGFVGDDAKHEILARSWVMALPSLKEGWGIVVTEAAQHRVPTVAYRSAGGTTESIDDKDSGVLVDSPAEFTDALRAVVTDQAWREHLGQGAWTKSQNYTWGRSADAFRGVLERA